MAYFEWDKKILLKGANPWDHTLVLIFFKLDSYRLKFKLVWPRNGLYFRGKKKIWKLEKILLLLQRLQLRQF